MNFNSATSSYLANSFTLEAIGLVNNPIRSPKYWPDSLAVFDQKNECPKTSKFRSQLVIVQDNHKLAIHCFELGF